MQNEGLARNTVLTKKWDVKLLQTYIVSTIVVVVGVENHTQTDKEVVISKDRALWTARAGAGITNVPGETDKQPNI